MRCSASRTVDCGFEEPSAAHKATGGKSNEDSNEDRTCCCVGTSCVALVASLLITVTVTAHVAGVRDALRVCERCCCSAQSPDSSCLKRKLLSQGGEGGARAGGWRIVYEGHAEEAKGAGERYEQRAARAGVSLVDAQDADRRRGVRARLSGLGGSLVKKS